MMTILDRLNSGLLEQQAGNFPQAEAVYRETLAIEPEHPDALHLLGVLLHQTGRSSSAVEYIRRAILARPGCAEYHLHLGVALRGAGNLRSSADSLRQALQLQPNSAKICNGLGITQRMLGDLDAALASFRRALELEPANVEARTNLGNTLKQKGDLAEAADSYREVLRLNPGLAEAHNNLGATLRDQGQPEAAVSCCRRALELKPNYAEAHNNLAAALKELGQLEEADRCYGRALQLVPNYAEARHNRGMLRLLVGDFVNGWPDYEWRWKTKDNPKLPNFDCPRWDGSPLPEKTVLIHTEQGLGDILQFVRYLALVKQRVGRVVLFAPQPLQALFCAGLEVDVLVTEYRALPDFDYYLPLLSLPGVFGTREETIPADVPYLTARSDLVGIWRERLEARTGLRVGICWQGNPTYGQDRVRSLPLSQFRPLAESPHVRLISLQKGYGVEQLEQLRGQFEVEEIGPDFDEQPGPFMDTAAVMKNLDLVVTVDTAIAHLAGALGVRVWLALPWIPDWRWLLDRDDSPWYPTMRLFRQHACGDWEGVFLRMGVRLRELLAGDSAEGETKE